MHVISFCSVWRRELLAIDQDFRGTVSYHIAVHGPVTLLTNTFIILLVDLLIALLILAPIVLGHIGDNKTIRDPADEEEPEEIDGLEGGEEGESDVLRDPAFVLLGLPVEFEWADGGKFGDNRPEYFEVQVMSHVCPDTHEQEEIGADEGGVEIVEDFGRLFATVSMAPNGI